MGNFKYVAVDKKGKRQEGTLGGYTREEVSQALRKMGLTTISIQPVKSRRRKRKFSEINLTPPRVDPKFKVIFFRELSTLLDAGIQLVDAISIVQLQFEDKNFRKALDDILKLVKAGHPFSESLAEHRNIFPGFVISMVKAAESGGGLDKILSQIAGYIEKEDDVRKRLKSATSYPKFIFGFMLLVTGGVMFGLMPKFKDIFASFGAELPASTLVIMNFSIWLKDHLILEAIVTGALFLGFKTFAASPKGKRFMSKNMFKMPIAGSMLHQSQLARMCKTLAVLLRADVSLIAALKIAGETADNVYIEEVVNEIAEQISHGRTLAGQMAKYQNIFPMMVSSMIAVGEKSGALSLMLEKISDFNEQEFNTRVDTLSKTIEPIVMGVLGVIVSIIVITLYLPIFQMTSNMH